jgi:hypothetical protein
MILSVLNAPKGGLLNSISSAIGDEWIKKAWPLWNVKPKNNLDHPQPTYIT